MAVYAVTGKLGAGKTLAAVSRIRDALNKNKKVATNLDLRLEKLINPFAKKTKAFRLPDVPSREDLDAIGLGYDGDFIGDEANGLIVFDECAKWLNSRSYRDKSRAGLIDWCIHARKKRWDIIFIIQDVEAMDKQFRDLFIEFIVYCRRMDRYKIPFVTALTQSVSKNGLRPFKLHVGLVKYGSGERSPVVDRWMYRGDDLYSAYDTEQSFSELDSPGLSCYLPPNTIHGQFVSKRKVMLDGFLALGTVPFLVGGLALGSFIDSWLGSNPWEPSKTIFSCNDVYEDLIGCDITPSQLSLILSDHRSGKESDGSGPDSSDPLPEDSPQDGQPVYISGSVSYSTGDIDYVFNRGDETYRPHVDGYKVYPISDCQAMLVSSSDPSKKLEVSCTSRTLVF